METTKIFCNVAENSYPLYLYCKENQFTSAESYEEFFENGEELQFYEGDPDMIKLNGETGYFADCGEYMFYYFDGDAKDCNIIEEMLKQTLSHEETELVENGEELQSWRAWDKMQTGIAYRGGRGYVYLISDWHKFVEALQN